MAISTVPSITDPRELALLKAVGLDRVSPEQRELALNIAQRYDLDLLLKHLVMIDGRPYVTRDGLLHIAHRSGQLDGIETTEPSLVDGFWRSTCAVYRKDMSRPFTYTGRYPEKGQNARFAPEMAVKVGEVMALRRAFDVAAPTAEERWDIDVPVVEPAPKPTLAAVAAERRQIIDSGQAGGNASEGYRAGSEKGSSGEPEYVDTVTTPAFTEAEAPLAPRCGWRLGLKGGEIVDCTLPEMHESAHSWQQQAVETGGRVIRPEGDR